VYRQILMQSNSAAGGDKNSITFTQNPLDRRRTREERKGEGGLTDESLQSAHSPGRTERLRGCFNKKHCISAKAYAR